MTTFPTNYPRAAKPHRCAECRRPIAVGERHARISGEVDGSAWSERMCLRCDRAYQRASLRFGGWDEDDGPCLGELASWMWERRSSLDAVRLRRARIRAVVRVPELRRAGLESVGDVEQ